MVILLAQSIIILICLKWVPMTKYSVVLCVAYPQIKHQNTKKKMAHLVLHPWSVIAKSSCIQLNQYKNTLLWYGQFFAISATTNANKYMQCYKMIPMPQCQWYIAYQILIDENS